MKLFKILCIVYLLLQNQAVFSQNLTVFKGVVSEAGTKVDLGVDIAVMNAKTNELVSHFNSNSKTGKFLISLPNGINYKIYYYQIGYVVHVEEISLEYSSGYASKNTKIQMVPILGTKTLEEESDKYDFVSTQIPLYKNDNGFEVFTIINGLMKVNFTFDNSSDFSFVSPDVAYCLLKEGTVKKTDWHGGKEYTFFDGTKVPGESFTIRNLKFGSIFIYKIKVTILESNTSTLVIGRDAKNKLGRVYPDYKNSVLKIERSQF